MQHGEEGNEATDIELIGKGVEDRLNDIVEATSRSNGSAAGRAARRADCYRLIPGYGPEVWHVNYSMEQFPQRGDYWETRIHRAKYLQDWPPEKGQPLTLVEFDYPPDDKSSDGARNAAAERSSLERRLPLGSGNGLGRVHAAERHQQ